MTVKNKIFHVSCLQYRLIGILIDFYYNLSLLFIAFGLLADIHFFLLEDIRYCICKDKCALIVLYQ